MPTRGYNKNMKNPEKFTLDKLNEYQEPNTREPELRPFGVWNGRDDDAAIRQAATQAKMRIPAYEAAAHLRNGGPVVEEESEDDILDRIVEEKELAEDERKYEAPEGFNPDENNEAELEQEETTEETEGNEEDEEEITTNTGEQKLDKLPKREGVRKTLLNQTGEYFPTPGHHVESLKRGSRGSHYFAGTKERKETLLARAKKWLSN